MQRTIDTLTENGRFHKLKKFVEDCEARMSDDELDTARYVIEDDEIRITTKEEDEE